MPTMMITPNDEDFLQRERPSPEPADPPPTDPAAAYVPLAALGAALHAWGVDLYGYSGKALELAQGAVNRLAFL